MQGLPGTVNTNRIILTLSILVSLAGILLPRFHFGEHETLSPTEAAVLPSTQFKQRGIKPQLVVDGVPIAELQPRYNPVEDLLFFSHIPRTAGGTFSVLLSALFPTQEQVPYSGTGSAVRDLTAYKSMTAEQWRDMHVLFAHEDLSFVKLIPKHVAVTVFLRDPIKHRRSSYYWGLLHPFRSYDDITSWVLSPDFPTLYQVEWMAGVSRWWPYSHHSEDYSLRIWHNKPLMMRLAKENLAQTTWFGITERFNESMCLFYYTHRLVPKEEGKDYRSIHRHVTQSAGEEAGVVTAAQYQKPRLGYEYEFFRWATKLFNLRLANMREDHRLHAKVMARYIAPECRGVLS